jgi:hypothetical protein
MGQLSKARLSLGLPVAKGGFRRWRRGGKIVQRVRPVIHAATLRWPRADRKNGLFFVGLGLPLFNIGSRADWSTSNRGTG